MSKYQPLEKMLHEAKGMETLLDFEAIENRLGFDLPMSARRHRAWWANEPETHVQARVWRNAGWQVWSVDLEKQVVRFRQLAADRGARRSGPENDGGGGVAIDLRNMSLAGAKLLRDYMDENGGDASAAVVRALHEAAIARRQRLLDRFPLVGERSSVDSVDLIREDRDAR